MEELFWKPELSISKAVLHMIGDLGEPICPEWLLTPRTNDLVTNTRPIPQHLPTPFQHAGIKPQGSAQLRGITEYLVRTDCQPRVLLVPLEVKFSFVMCDHTGFSQIMGAGVSDILG